MIEIKVVLEAGDSLKELVKLLTASSILLAKQEAKEEKKPSFTAEVAKAAEAKQKATEEAKPINTTKQPEPVAVEPKNPVGGVVVDPKPEDQKPGAAEAFVKDLKAEAATEADVRKIAVDKIKAGKRDAVKALIGKYGADKLSAIPADKLSDFAKELEAI